MRHRSNIQASGALRDDGLRRDGDGLGLRQVGHHRRVTHQVIDFPIVQRVAALGGHGHIACHHHGGLGGVPLRVGLVVGVAQTVVGAQVAGVVGHRHRGADAVTCTHRPVEVIGPVGAVAGADIAHRTAIVAPAEQRLAETGILVEGVALAAVANHQAELLVVAHRRHIVRAEIRRTPAAGAAVGGIVNQAGTFVVAVAHNVCIGRGAVIYYHIGRRGHNGGVVLEVLDLLEATSAVDVVGDGIIHGGVAVGIGVVARSAGIHTRHHHGAVEERRVLEGVLLIHQRFLYLRGQLAHVLRRETATVAVGHMVAGGPGGVIQVGDMVVVALTGEGRYLRHIAHQQQVGGGRLGGRGVGVLALDIV